MSLNTIKEMERAVGLLSPQEIAELYAWLDQHFPQPRMPGGAGRG